jgi:hypothetical protein
MTHQLISEFREHCFAVKWGEDVLALYDTLYHVYRSLAMLEELSTTQRNTPGALTAHNPPFLNHPIPASSSERSDPLPMLEALATMQQNTPDALDLHDDNSAMMVDHMPPPPAPRRDTHKLLLRRQNEQIKRRNAASASRQSANKADFLFICPVSEEHGYFNRNGILQHL